MGLRKHKPLDDSQHKLQKKVSPIKSSGLLVTPQKPTVVKATAAAANGTIKKKARWSKNNQRRLLSSSPLHRSGHVFRSTRFQRQVIVFLAVLFYHSENPEFSSILPSLPPPELMNNATITDRQQQQQRNGIGMTLRNARTHSIYSWIPKGTKTSTLTASNNRTAAPLWKETIQVAQDTSVAIVHQSQKVFHQFGSVSMAFLSFRWAVPPKWKPQKLEALPRGDKSERKLLWLSSSPASSSLFAATMDGNSLTLLPSLPQQYLRATASSSSSSKTTTTLPSTTHEIGEKSTPTTTSTTTMQPPQQVLLARLWQQASTPAQKLLQSLSTSTSSLSSPAVAALVGGPEKNLKIRDWVDKIYGASITTHPYYYYDSLADSSNGASGGGR